MRFRRTLGALAALTLAGPLSAEEPLDLGDETARTNYSLGYQVGADLKRQGIALDAPAVVKGIEDALSGAEPALGEPEMDEILLGLKRKIVARERTTRREAELEQVAKGEKFLAENAKQPGVVTTASGLQYRILEPGTGKRPGPTDSVTLNYRGTLVEGNPFDDSTERGGPQTFRLGGVIPAWTEGLQLIREGGRIQLFVPPKLAYRDRGPLAHRTLIYDVELISVGEGE
jgi:FKBP-type peptidyl-prolyl cis-trans isomerase FklB